MTSLPLTTESTFGQRAAHIDWTRWLLGLLLGGMAVLSPGTLVVLGLLGATLAVIWRLAPEGERRWLVRMTVGAWVLRVGLSALLHLWHGWFHPYGPLALEADSGGYMSLGWFVSEVWRGRYASLEQAALIHWDLFHGIQPFIYVMGALFYLFGFSPVAATFLNAWVTLVGFLIGYALARDLAGARAARAAFLLMIITPSWTFWSICHGKEPLLLVGIMWWFWASARWLRERRWRDLLSLLMSGLLLGSCRSWMLPIFMSVIGLWTVVAWAWRRRGRRIGAVAVSLAGAMAVMSIASWRTRLFTIFQRAAWNMMSRSTNVGTIGGSAFSVYGLGAVTPATWRPWLWLQAYARSWRQVMLTYWPPGHVTSMAQWTTLPEVLWIDLLLVCAAVGWHVLLWQRRRLDAWCIVTTLCCYLSVLGLSEGNLGTLFRHKHLMLPIYWMVVAVGWQWLWDEGRT